MKPIRNITNIEQLYEDVQSVTNAYAIQFILKTNNIKNKDVIEHAIERVIKSCPEFNVYLKRGKFYPQQSLVHIIDIEIKDSTIYDLDLFKRKIDLNDHSIEVFFVKALKDKYLVFRFAHSAMDGKSALLFMQNIANSLNGKELIKCKKAISEKDFLKKLNYYKKNEPKLPRIIHDEASTIKRYTTRWQVVRLNTYVPSIIAKLSRLLAQEFKSSRIRVMVPVDLRRHDNNSPYIGNLTLPIFLNIDKSDSYIRINGELLCGLKDSKELNISNALNDYYCHMPSLLRKMGVKIGCMANRHYNRFSVGAVISHLGRIDLNDYSNKYFKVKDFVDLSIQQPLGAFSIVIVECSHRTNISIGYYEDQFSEEYMRALIKKIEGLV